MTHGEHEKASRHIREGGNPAEHMDHIQRTQQTEGEPGEHSREHGENAEDTWRTG